MKQEENINLIGILHNFYRYKWSVLTISIVVFIATFFYIRQLIPIYSSHILIGIGSYQKSNISSLFPNNSIWTDIDTKSLANHEIKILKSRHIISQTLNKIDLTQQFFIQHKWNNQEIYKNEVPFRVKFKNRTSKKSSFHFTLKELETENFTLMIESSNHKKEKVLKKCKYGQLITMDNYELKVSKKTRASSLLGVTYHINIETNRDNLISRLSNNLSIDKEGPTLLRINYEDSIPKRAKDILIQLVLSYEQYDLKVRQMKDVKNITFLNKMILELENSLKKIGNRLKRYKLQHNELLILGSEDKVFADTIERNRNIDKLSLKLNALKTTKERIEKGIYSISLLENSNLQTKDINQLIERLRKKNKYLILLSRQKNNLDTLLIHDAPYQDLLKKFKNAKEKLRTLTFEYTDQHPEVQKTYTDIDFLESELMNYLSKNIKKSNREIENLKKEIYTTITILIHSINQEYSSIEKSLKKDVKQIEKLPNSTMQLEELKRTFKVTETNYKKLLQTRSESLISKESTISNIQIIDTATLPLSPIKPKRNFLYLSGLILGLVLSIIYTSVKIRNNRKIYSRYDISSKNYSIIYEEKNMEKNFWTLITHLEKITPKGEAKTILFSANEYEENKSSTVHKLSLKLSKISKKVLIIDFDVYYPNLTKSLNLNSSIGLSTLLTNKHPLNEIDIKSLYIQSLKEHKEYKEINILSSGPILPNGSALLFSSKVRPLLEILSKEYDYILIDAPPLGKYPEINILLSYVNIFLVVIKMGKTDKFFFDKLQNIEEKNIEKIIFST